MDASSVHINWKHCHHYRDYTWNCPRSNTNMGHITSFNLWTYLADGSSHSPYNIILGCRHWIWLCDVDLSNEHLWNAAESGDGRPLRHAFIKVSLVESVEGIGFFILIICMVLI